MIISLNLSLYTFAHFHAENKSKVNCSCFLCLLGDSLLHVVSMLPSSEDIVQSPLLSLLIFLKIYIDLQRCDSLNNINRNC